MKKNILVFLFLFSFVNPSLFAQVETPEPLYISKTATALDDNRMKLTLESFVSGNNKASDIVILMDLSASMQSDVTGSPSIYTRERALTEEDKLTSSVKGKTTTVKNMAATTKGMTTTVKNMAATTKARKTNHVSTASRNGAWTYNTISSTGHFPFCLYEGQYYRVQRGNNLGPNGNIRALWIDTPDGKKYLTGTTISSDNYGTVTSDGGTIYTGILYYGFTWAGITGGTNAGETPMTYLYKGEYYPVKRHRFDADGTRNDSGDIYALWIETPYGIKFLNGNGLQNLPDPAVTANNIHIFCGDLYDSGWTYALINGPFYYNHGGVYYPVHKKLEGGTYSLFIEVGESTLYLNGEGVSDHPVASVRADNQSIFFGDLYSGGWSHYDVGADESTYSYLYEGNYYPVKRGRFDADGTPNASGTVYAIYIEIGGVKKFLSGNGLQDKPYELVTTTGTAATRSIFSGTLYSGGWSYAQINGPFYYMDEGVLYPVHKGPNNAPFYLYVEIGGDTKYLKGEGLSDSYEPSVKANSQTIFFGDLYSGGWSHYDVGADESTYSYLYEGNYYPVKRGRFNADGTPNASGTVYAIYIEIGGVKKFLSGNGLQDKPYELVTTSNTAATRSIFSGTLYSGGWSYSAVTGDNVYFYLLNGVYYPVKRSNALSDGHGNNNTRALWIEVEGVPKYLRGDGLANDNDYEVSVRTNDQGIFYGVLFTGGWSYTSLGAGDETGKVENQWYYKHIDGNYYPVRRAKNIDGNVRAMWICLDPNNPSDRKYLSGQGLSDTYDSSITADEQIIYLGPLYKGWTYGTGNGFYYKHTDDNYYPVARESDSNGRQLYVEIGGDRYYLNGNTVLTTANPYAANNDNISLFFDDLYYARSSHRKGDYLQEAVDALLTTLAHDAKVDELDHRVALAQFNSSGWMDGRTAESTLPNPTLDVAPIGGANAHLVSDFKVITDDDNLAALKAAMVMPHTIDGVSHYEWGMSLAKSLFRRELSSSGGEDFNNDGTIEDYEIPTLNGEEYDNYPSRPKIVVIVGDCEHNGGASADDDYANALKNELGALIFVVYVNTSTGTPLTNAKAWASREDLISKVSQFDETLIPTFQKLAREIREALIALGKQTVMQDVVAEGFEIPSEGGNANVKVYLSDYLTGKTKEEMTFDDAHRVPATDSITVNIDGSTVNVSGFDYSENYCGTIAGVPHGKKLTLELEIERTSAVGGPSAVTNVAETSGIKKDNGDFVANFTTNTITPLPVNIQIQKEGLAKGESAVFTVQPIDQEGNPISSVLVEDVAVPVKPHRLILTGNASGTPVTATLKHLNINCNWLVTEEDWNWEYVANGGNPSLSTATQLLNPFVFTNVKQNTTVKAAESKVTNDFSAQSSETVSSRE